MSWRANRKKPFTAKIVKKGRKERKEMSDDVCFPVYVLAKDCGEVTEYASRTTMQGYMEAVDVEGDEYEAWDAGEYVVRLSVATPRSAWLRVSRMSAQISEQELPELKAGSRPYREPEGGLHSLRRVLFGR